MTIFDYSLRLSSLQEVLLVRYSYLHSYTGHCCHVWLYLVLYSCSLLSERRLQFRTMSWYVYMMRCADDSLYTGITTDIERRLQEHNGTGKGAKYTKARRPVNLVYQEQVPDRSAALIKEHALRQLQRSEKLKLAMNQGV